MYRTQYPKTPQCTFFPGVHETFSKIDYMLNNKLSLNKPQNSEAISSMFSDHNKT